MPTERDFHEWAAELRKTHPEMFTGKQSGKSRPARAKWDPIFLRVYGIRPWEIGHYTLREYAAMVSDLERHGLGGGI